MKNRIIAVFCLAVIAVAAIVLITMSSQSQDKGADHVYRASADTGYISETVVGNPSTAKVVVYEYADYGCSHCSAWNSLLNDYYDKNSDKLAVVFRYFSLNYSNSPTVAKATTAAHIQGYWRKFKDLVFGNQADWFSLSPSKLSALLLDYFDKASDGQGDKERFQQDMTSANVEAFIAFNRRLADSLEIKATPTFRINGETIKNTDMQDTLDSLLAE